MASYSPKLLEKKYNNWVKAQLAVLFTKEGVEPFVCNEMQQFQLKCLHDICYLNGLFSGTCCSSCCTENVVHCRTDKICKVNHGKCSYHRNVATRYNSAGCPNKICHNFKTEIQNTHRYNGPSYKNSDATQWCSNFWEVAKCFMPPDGYKEKASASETDFNGIISVILNHKDFQGKVHENLSNKINIFEEARVIGRNVRHSSKLEVEDSDLQNYFQLLQKLLSDPVYLGTDTHEQDAKQKLIQLENDTLVIGKDEIRKVLDDVATAIQDKMKAGLDEKYDKIKLEMIRKEQEDLLSLESKTAVGMTKIQDKTDALVKRLNEQGAKERTGLTELGETLQKELKTASKAEKEEQYMDSKQPGFESTMKELSDNFNHPNEMTDIQAKLRDSHHIVVTGCNTSRYCETALAAIKGYNYEQSVEMDMFSDWKHIDPEDVDLVLCRDPLWRYFYDKSKANSMDDISKGMKHSSKAANGNKTLAIVIVTDLEILEKCKMHNDQEILDEMMKVFTDTRSIKLTDVTRDHRWAALLIAGNDTKDTNRVEISKALAKDVKELEKLLTSLAPPVFGISKSNIRTVVPSAPDKLNDGEKLWPKVKANIKEFSKRTDIIKMLIYISCHGARSNGSGNTNDFQFQLGSSPDDSITLDQFEKELEHLGKIEKLIILLDRCYPPLVRFEKRERVYIQMNSCKQDQKAQMDSKGSFFTRVLIRGLKAKSDGKIFPDNCQPCIDYWNGSKDFIAVHNLYNYIKGHLDNNKQTPIYVHNWNDHSSNIAFYTGDKVEIQFSHGNSSQNIPLDHLKTMKELEKILKDKFGRSMEMMKSVELFCGNATTIQVPVPARLLGMTKQETSNTEKFISCRMSVELDTNPHFCQLCRELPTFFGSFSCMQEKYQTNGQKESSHDVELIFQHNDSERETFEDYEILTDTDNIIDIHSSICTKEFTSTNNTVWNILEGSTENRFGVNLGKSNTNTSGSSVSILRDIRRPCRLSTYCLDTLVRGSKRQRYDCNSVRKLRVQVVQNQSLQPEEQFDVKVIQGGSSRSWKTNHNNDSFCNLKYKVNAKNSLKKKIDCTLQEEDFDHMMLLRRVTWLSVNELPVPEIDLTVAHLTNFEPIMEIIDLIAAGTPPTPHISMRYELLRFCTLRSYPKEDKPYLIKLAEAGFYYASDGDGVVCYCCGIRRYNWTAEDNPRKIHERINPSCKFLRKNEEVNVPVQYFGPYSKELMAIMEIPEPIERPQVSEDVNNDWAPERIRTPASQQPNRPNESGTNALGINTAIPKHSQYATKTAREASYSTWPDTSSHTPEVLADAGFFYAGFGDCVRCFYCGIGLRHWTAEDDPWIEHARWSKNCVFVKQKKGEEFVNLVQLAVQYSQDNETNPSGQNQLQSQEIERLLLSDAAQSVLEMGYQPRLIKKSIEEILKQNGDTNITAQLLMEKVLEIEESENRSQSAPQATATITSSATVAQATATTTTNTATAVQVKTGTGKPEITKPEESKEAKTKSKAEKKLGKFDASKENKSKEKKEDKGKEDKDESQEDPKAIKKENEELKEQTLCKVCLDNTVCIVFLPCGHLVTCADCAPAMRKCPICRALVKGTVRTYMS